MLWMLLPLPAICVRALVFSVFLLVSCASHVLAGGLAEAENDPGFRILSLRAVHGTLLLQFESEVGWNYFVQFAKDPAGPWINLTTGTAGRGGGQELGATLPPAPLFVRMVKVR